MNIEKFNDLNSLSIWAADFISDLAAKCVKEKGFFSMSLCGGSSPHRLLSMLTAKNIDWSKVYIFWGDERFVDINDENSNYKMAYDIFLSKIKIPKKNIFITPTNELTPEKTAYEYEETVINFFTAHKDIESLKTPAFDLVLLGAGNDGHTASLFPNISELEEKSRLVVNTKSPEYAVIDDRISFTFKLINGADTILLLFSGKEKKEILERFLDNKNEKILPIEYVDRSDKTHVLIDLEIYN
jgi:6-phosphogluconolactonase